MPILIALDGVEDDAELDDAAAAPDDDEELLLLPQAAVHSPQMAQMAATVNIRGSRCAVFLSKLVTS